MILMYHRIAEPDLDPWQLCVSPENFAQHLERLGQTFEFIRLSDVPTCQKPEKKAVITFDDGYLDNLLMAKPILEQYSVPATVFVTTGYIGKKKEFWWDQLEQLFLLPGVLPRKIEFEILGILCSFEFKLHRHYPSEFASNLQNWKVTYDGTAPPTERHCLFLDIWGKLQKAPEASRRSVMDYLFSWAGREPELRQTHQTMSQDALIQLIDNGLIDVGSHCVTHGALNAMGHDEQSEEINTSKQCLESIIGSKILSLAYPHGEFDRETCEMTRSAGYKCAVGTNRYRVDNFDTHFQLKRKTAFNIPGDLFQARVIDRCIA
jgi:peptidoglycan/xylan/chitin deacetylase (PgdA/CDA1 family)